MKLTITRFCLFALVAILAGSSALAQSGRLKRAGEMMEDLNYSEAIRTYTEILESSDDPEATLTAFLQSTYAAAADLARWDREALDCPLQVPRVPRAP